MVLEIKTKDDYSTPKYESTEEIPVVSQTFNTQVRKDGTSTCRMLNGIMFNTHVLIYIDIGGIRHRCIEFYPLYLETIRVKLEGGMTIEVPWYTDFVIKLGRTLQEFRTLNK